MNGPMKSGKYVTPAVAKGVGPTNNPAPGANLPANNVGNYPVKAASKSTAGGGSSMGKSASIPAGESGTTTSSVGGNSGSMGGATANMPAHNVTGTRGSRHSLGTTKPGLGKVPGYLK